MEIMAVLDLEFETFDIFSDEDVRQGLKSYSNWPTYPQVYVNGELIGGLDIIKELKEAGELLSTLKGEAWYDLIDAGNPILWSNLVKFISENYKYYEDGFL